MRFVEMNWTKTNATGPADHVKVSWCQGAQPMKSKVFASVADAVVFAEAKMGKTGMVVSNLYR